MADEILDAAEEPTTDPVLLDSILDTIKKMIGLSSDYDAFNTDIIIHINSAFFTLHQLGVGSRPVFTISDSTKTWIEFSDDSSVTSAVKQYIYLKVRMAFDPPSASSVLNQYSASIQELEWRIRELADGIFDEEEGDDSETPESPSDEPINPDDPTTPTECNFPDVATDEEVGTMLDKVYGDSSVPTDQEIATDEEVQKILDNAFGEDTIATDEEVGTMLYDIFGGS